MTPSQGRALITSASVESVIQDKDDPNWRFALAARPTSASVVVTLRGVGDLVGYGSGGEIPHLGYSLEAVTAAAKDCADDLVAAQPSTPNSALSFPASLRRSCPPAACAVEMAVLDLQAKASGQRLCDFFGGPLRDRIPLLRILGLKRPEDMASSAKARVAEGYRFLKIKLDNESLDLDAARVAAVREAVGPGIGLTLDANQSYSPADAIRLYRKVAHHNIDLFEQPVPSGDLEGLRLVSKELPCMVEADESAHGMSEIIRILDMRAADAISLKLPKMGGVNAVLAVAAMCTAVGIKVRLGAHVGNSLLTSAALHVATVLPELSYACELGEFARLLGDPFTGLDVVSGELALPKGAGAGIVPK